MNQSEELPYEQAMLELESIISKMEDGHLPMDDMLNAYKRAAELLSYCKSKVVRLEEQVKMIDSTILPTWDDDN
ncbi:MAG: exodeoxyribonuclease VII small subunit [Gammaproteobacteria bacterium]|nr:exodeoxyribonuclease VII small subunit [Gammaproteobacteria bacterium]